MIFSINRAIKLEGTNTYFKIGDLVDVTTKDNKKFTGKILEIEEASFVLDFGTAYSSRTLTIALNEILNMAINTTEPVTSDSTYIIRETYR